MTTNIPDRYLTGIKNNDRALIKAIFEDHFPMIFSLVKKNSGTREDARDIFMDALVCILERLEKGDLVLTCSFSTFLYEVCRRLWLKKLRRNKFVCDTAIEDSNVLEMVDEMESGMEKNELDRLIRQQFLKLSADCQKLLDLSWHTNKDMQTISDEMGWTYGYARKRKSICTDKLKVLIKKDQRIVDFMR